MKKPTPRELAVLLKDKRMPARQPSWPYPDRAVRIVKDKYKGADRFVVHFRDPDKRPDPRTKWWFHNWRHACAASLHVNDGLERAAGTGHCTFNDAADRWLKWCEGRARAKEPTLSPASLQNCRGVLNHLRPRRRA
jgi:hypothetical protein